MLVHTWLFGQLPGIQVEHDAKRRGVVSGRMRQIDTLVSQPFLGEHGWSCAVDAKDHRRKVDIKLVESFISMVDDVGGAVARPEIDSCTSAGRDLTRSILFLLGRFDQIDGGPPP